MTKTGGGDEDHLSLSLSLSLEQRMRIENPLRRNYFWGWWLGSTVVVSLGHANPEREDGECVGGCGACVAVGDPSLLE